MVGKIQHHRPVPDDDPLIESVAVIHECVKLHAVAAALPLDGNIGLYAAVSKNIVRRFDDVRHGMQEVPLGLESFGKLRDEAFKVHILAYLNAHFREHIPHKAALFKQHVFYDARAPVLPFGVDHIGPCVAVAADNTAVAALGKLHYKAQSFKAPFAFFEKVAVDDKLVGLGKADLFEKPFKIGHVCVYVRNGDDPPTARVELLHTRVNVPH